MTFSSSSPQKLSQLQVPNAPGDEAFVPGPDTPRLSRLLEVQHKISEAGLDLQGVARAAVEGARRLTEAEGAAFQLLQEDTTNAVVLNRISSGNVELMAASVALRDDLAARCLQSGRIEMWGAPESTAIGPEARAMIGVPLRLRSNLGRPEGVLILVSSRAGAFAEDDKQALSLLTAFTEASLEHASSFLEREAVLQSLRDSEMRFEAFMDNSPAACFLKDEAGRYVYVNRAFKSAFEHAFHKDAQMILGQTREAIFSPEAAPLTKANDETILRSGLPAQFLEDLPTVDGRLQQWLTSRFLLHDTKGQRLIGGVCVDVTERREHEAARTLLEKRLSSVIANAPLIIWALNAEGIFTFSAGRILSHLGVEPGSNVGRSVFEVYGHVPEVLAATRCALQGQETSYLAEVAGRVFDSHLSVQRDEAGQVAGVIGVATDITERVKSEERYSLAARGANDGLWDWDLSLNRVYYSPRWKEMLGCLEDEIGDSPEEWVARIHPEDAPIFREALRRHFERAPVERVPSIAGGGARVTPFQSEHRVKHQDGTYRWMLARGVAIRDGAGRATRMAGSQTDVTERRVAEEQLIHNAFYDALTGLPNRSLFMDRLGHAIERANRRQDYRFAILFLDLDRFKVINDSLGHAAGDKLLIEATRRLSSCLRPSDTVARLGGDEFVILVDDVRDLKDVTHLASRLQENLSAPFSTDGHEIYTTASIGIALSPRRDDEQAQSGGSTAYLSAQDMLRDADIAMYRAKSAGKARYEIFDSAMHQRALMLLQLESDLRHAIERHELLLHYQPIIDLQNGKIGGFEALVRWQHPERGMVNPGEFIPLAEDTGLIIPIGAWVLREACAQLHAWLCEFEGLHLTMSVNISSKQFSQPNLVLEVSQVLRDMQLDPSFLKLEITESVIMENAESAALMLHELKALGVNVSVDDFGTGYSSLSSLSRFPLDQLKIDRSFVLKLQEDENAEIVRAIVSLSRALHLNVVAEGIENPEQLQQLRGLRCDLGQGYFFSRPLDRSAIAPLLTQNKRW